MGNSFWQKPSIRILLGCALALLSAFFLIMAFPPNPYWPLIFIACIPFLLAQYRVLPEKWSALAPALAIGVWIGVYFTKIFGFGGGGAWYMRAFPIIIFVISFFAERGNRALHERTNYKWLVLQGVTGWVGFEMIRSFIPTLGTWAFVGYPLYAQLWFIQPLSLIGIFGLDFVIILANFTLVQGCIQFLDKKAIFAGAPALDTSLVRRWMLVFLVILLVWSGASLLLFNIRSRVGDTITVAAIQHAYPVAAHMDKETPQTERLQTLMELSKQAVAEGAQLVVWPELGLGFDPQQQYTDQIVGLAQETGAYLVVGYSEDVEQSFRNEATVLNPAGEFLGIYGKAHPVVFGGEPYGINAGTFPVYETSLGKMGTIICYDLNFTDSARKLARQGAQFIAIPSLDFSGIADVQYTQAVLRAVENRVALIKADVGYDSAIIDPYGQIVAYTSSQEVQRTYLMAEVPIGTGNTLYSRLGDWFGWLNLLGLFFFAFFSKKLRG